MADGKWEKMNKTETTIWEQDWKDGMKNPKEDKSKKTKNGITTEIVTQTYVYPVFTPSGYDTSIIHKCIRCDKRHDHYIYMEPSEGGQARPDLVYTPLHVAENHWGQGRGKLYSAVVITGSSVRRIEKTTSRGTKIISKEVTWEVKTLNHREERDFVVLDPFKHQIDCISQIQETAFGLGEYDAQEYLLAMLSQDQGVSLSVTSFADSAEIMSSVNEVFVNIKNPGMSIKREFNELSVMVIDKEDPKKPVEVGMINLVHNGSELETMGWEVVKKIRRGRGA